MNMMKYLERPMKYTLFYGMVIAVMVAVLVAAYFGINAILDTP